MLYNSRRKGFSQYVAALLLVSIGMAGSVAVYGIMNQYTSIAQSGPQISIDAAQLVQGTNIATLKVIAANTGNAQFTSLSIRVSGLETSSATFAGQASVVDAVTGSALYSVTFAPATPVTSVTISTNMNINQNVVIVCSFQQTSSGAGLFLVGHSYNLLISTQPYSQATELLVAATA